MTTASPLSGNSETAQHRRLDLFMTPTTQGSSSPSCLPDTPLFSSRCFYLGTFPHIMPSKCSPLKQQLTSNMASSVSSSYSKTSSSARVKAMIKTMMRIVKILNTFPFFWITSLSLDLGGDRRHFFLVQNLYSTFVSALRCSSRPIPYRCIWFAISSIWLSKVLLLSVISFTGEAIHKPN